MSINIVERPVAPYNDTTNFLRENTYSLYAPTAGVGKIGMAGYNARHFRVTDQGIVELSTVFLDSILHYGNIADICNAPDGIKTKNTLYPNFETMVIEKYEDDVPIFTSVTGYLFVMKDTDTNTFTQTEVLLADNNFWIRHISVVDNVVTEVTPFVSIYNRMYDLGDLGLSIVNGQLNIEFEEET